MGKLEGKIGLVTGGTSGIGLATAKRFVDEGAYVFITGRRESELTKAVKEIGRSVSGVQSDVSKLDDLDHLFAQIKHETNRLDVVFANAGIAKYARLGKITEDFYDSIFNINVKGVVFTVQKALPLLPDGASIVLNSSIVGSKGLFSNSVYSATKAAIRSFARTWTTDLKDRHIRVNAISPGSIDTPGLGDLLASSETGEERKKMIDKLTPLGRFGTPDEIAKTNYLLEPSSEALTGRRSRVIMPFPDNSAALWRSGCEALGAAFMDKLSWNSNAGRQLHDPLSMGRRGPALFFGCALFLFSWTILGAILGAIPSRTYGQRFLGMPRFRVTACARRRDQGRRGPVSHLRAMF